MAKFIAWRTFGIVERLDLGVELQPDHEGGVDAVDGDACLVPQLHDLQRLQELRDIDCAALQQRGAARRSRHLAQDHRVHRRLARASSRPAP